VAPVEPQPAEPATRPIQPQPANPLRPGAISGTEIEAAPRATTPLVNPLRPDAAAAPDDEAPEPLPEAGPPVYAREQPIEDAAGTESALAPSEQLVAEVDQASSDYTLVKVFYGTDRLPVDAEEHLSGVWWLVICLLVLAFGCGWVAFGIACGRARSAVLGAAVALLAGCAAALIAVQLGDRWLVLPARDTQIARHYGNDRGPVELGVCEVAIPRDHRIGKIERPSVFRLEFREDPRRHVTIIKLQPQPPEEFFRQLRQSIHNSKLRQAFVFVHGFNVTFDDAARRTAQLAYDLQFDGAAIFFSWPSQGGLLQYAVDETNVAWAVPHLNQFLLHVAQQSQAEAIHLIAHSMGNRALTAALQSLALEMREQLPLFNEVVLTAPDIDAEVFQRDIAPAIIPTARRVTLYASSNDEALKLSKQIHGYRRAGDSGEGLLVIPGIDTVDVSAVDTSLIGHAYYGDNRTVLADLWDLIRESKPPQLRRWLQPAWMGQLVYWVFRRDITPTTRGRQSRPPVPDL